MVANLKRLRTRMGVSQQQIAEIIGTSQQSVNKYENHSIEPDIQTLKKLADFFGITIDYLVGHTPSSSIETGEMWNLQKRRFLCFPISEIFLKKRS